MSDGKYSNVAIFDYDRQKICDLYDSKAELEGQAFGIAHTRPLDGLDTLSFSIPYLDGDNFRWQYLKNEYLIRLVKGNKKYWFVANKPEKSKSGGEIIGTVDCQSTANILKTKNIYMEFDDENGIGTMDELLELALVNTGWTLGFTDPMYEEDGTTEKVRSLTSNGKDGALELISTICNLFRARPEFDTDTHTLNVYDMKNRNQATEGVVGLNLGSLTVVHESKDIITRLYVEGEYGEFGYVGIDDVNPTGLSYLLNFDYYKELGMWKPAHEAALTSYLTNISAIKQAITANQQAMTTVEDQVNTLIGQCVLSLYYVSSGFTTPVATYGSPTSAQRTLTVGDDVVVLNSSGYHRYETIETTPQALIQTGDYGIAKFALPAAGSMGGKEVQIEAKEAEITNLRKKIRGTSRKDAIAEYNKEIALRQAEIELLLYGPRPELKNTLAAYFIPQGYDGNVDLRDRIIVPRATITASGWDDDNEYETLLIQHYSAGTLEGCDFTYTDNVMIQATPIKADGTVMTEYALTTYIGQVIEAATTNGDDILDEDTLGLVLAVTEIAEGTELQDAIADDDIGRNYLQGLQSEWDEFRARCDWFGETGLDPAGIFSDMEGLFAEDGICNDLDTLMEPNGLVQQLDEYKDTYEDLSEQQDECEADFIIAMGDLLRDGYWANENYIPGQEEALYADAIGVMEQMSKPAVTYDVDYIRLRDEFGVSFEDLQLNDIVHINDEEMNVHDVLYIHSITEGIDDKEAGELEISNQEISIDGGSLGQLLGRMSQLADLIKQKNALYERAKAISKNGTIYVDRLNGQIDVVKNQIMSSVSNWYTDERGNMIFLSADGGSAMMLSGAGFMLASAKDDEGNWLWRLLGTGDGLTASEIVAGFISADRIEAGSIATSKLEPDAGNKLVITNNPAITGIEAQIQLLPDQIVSYVGSLGIGRTYTQLNDPATEIDPETGELKYTIYNGDYWFVPPKDPEIWQDKNAETWDEAEDSTWGLDYGKGILYLRVNDEWVEVFNQSDIIESYTQITQTNEAIKLEAVRASRAEGRLEASITITAREIKMNVSSLNSKTQYLQDDGKISLEAFTVTTAQEVATRAGITLDSQGRILLSAANFDHLGASSSSSVYITPTSISLNTSGSLTANAGGAINISGGSLNVTSSGSINITSGSLNVTSDGDINVTGGSINVTSSGDITVDGGTIEVKSGGQLLFSSTNMTIGQNGALTATNSDVGGVIRASELYINNTKASLSVDNAGKITLSSLSESVVTTNGFNTTLTNDASFTLTSTTVTTLVTKTGINSLGQNETLYGKISTQADQISLVVTQTQGGNVVNAASIVTAINNAGSSVTISANKINLHGNVSISDLTEYGQTVTGFLDVPNLYCSGQVSINILTVSSMMWNWGSGLGVDAVAVQPIAVNGTTYNFLIVDSKPA